MNYVKNPSATKYSAPAKSKKENKIISFSNKKTAVKNTVNWQVGDQVTHKKWGVGTIMEINKDNLTIKFANPEIGEKKLNAAIAPISKVQIDD